MTIVIIIIAALNEEIVMTIWFPCTHRYPTRMQAHVTNTWTDHSWIHAELKTQHADTIPATIVIIITIIIIAAGLFE